MLDTHVWLWMLTAPERLTQGVRELVTNEENLLYLSAASGWEIAIKFGLGKLPLPEPPRTYVPSRMTATGVSSLEVNMNHVLQVAELEHHHADPFDRVILCQSRIENMPLITADRALAAYDANIVWAV